MNSSEKILFLYASPNGGHKECADALRKVFQLNAPSVQTYGIDTISYFYPILGSLVAKTYLEILRYTPQIWNFLYDNPDVAEITREIRQIFNLFNAQKLKSFLAEFEPTAIVCTHALPCGALAQQKKSGKLTHPLIAVITDFAVHSYWIYPEVDLYIVANETSQETLVQRGIEKNRVKVCGIPIDPDLCKNIKSAQAREKLGLDPKKFTLLVMGGSHGHGPILKIVKEILSLGANLQMIVVAGLNKDLEKELTDLSSAANLLVFGYTRMVSLLMDASDIILTKPGGITTSEALVKGLPILLVNPIPGQEERNSQYLVQNGAALEAEDVEELRKQVKGFLMEPQKLNSLKEGAKKIACPNSSLEAAQLITQLLPCGCT